MSGEASDGPSQADLRKATSTGYYALFHCLARNAADLFVGSQPADRHEEAWRLVYRALDHGPAHNACRDKAIMGQFSTEISVLAEQFVLMQAKRNKADYDPFAYFEESQVIQDLDDAATAIANFESAPEPDKRAFAAHVLFRRRGAR